MNDGVLQLDRPLTTLDELVTRLGRDGSEAVVGVCAAAQALLLRKLLTADDRPIVVVVADPEAAYALRTDLQQLAGAALEQRRSQADPGAANAAAGCIVIDSGEQSPYAEQIPDRRAGQRRSAALLQLALSPHALIILPAAELLRKVPRCQAVLGASIKLSFGEELERDDLLERLTQIGYLRAPLVEDAGTFAARGGLIDVWSPADPTPVRIELDGDLISSMRAFDPRDQRSGEEIDTLWLSPARDGVLDQATKVAAADAVRDRCDAVDWPSSKTRLLIEDVVLGRAFFGAAGFAPALCELVPLIEQLPQNALLVLDEPSRLADLVTQGRAQWEEEERERAEQPHYPVRAFCIDEAQLDAWLEPRRVLALNNTPLLGDGGSRVLRQLAEVDDAHASVGSSDQAELVRAVAAARTLEGHAAGLDPLVERIQRWQQEGLRVVISARASTQLERLATMLSHRGLDVAAARAAADMEALLSRPQGSADVVQVQLLQAGLSRGTVCASEGLVLVTEEEIFGARKKRKRTKSKRAGKRLADDLRSLTVGDHVVHIEHGVGRYDGLVNRQLGSHTVDLLVVAYAGGDKLYLPVYRLSQLHKYSGGDAKPKVDKLGGQTFARAKSRAAKKVRQMADELLKLYAERQNAEGEACPPVDDEYRAFEASFPYEETDDQQRAIVEVNADLEATRPMDRLICGDVGFGKTEVALRAAFRVAMSGRQVAVLCPTTVLAQQHALTFGMRMAGYPIEVAVLSRFQLKRNVSASIRGLRNGSVDIAIGTHRLLSKDVHFKKLGLLVVDEEQRFGVAAKERIKALKTNVDVLTLSATPIPRTMQMAISGLRDLSVMTTPPAERRAVRTIVTRDDPGVLREAIERELGRGGQLFFVHNRIAGLEQRAAYIQQLAPQARIAVAHGQMNERLLEKTMLEFVAGHYDVLCTTAIIENGLDISRCNTIIIDRADMFGLAQLYQLRGRVGRSRERGYCYLVLPPGGKLGGDVRTRLEALQRYTALGSGFQIASLDLDLRGGGELLGGEQSGAVAAVGFEMFCRMLERAVNELRGEPLAHDVDPELSFDVEALLPENYIDDVGVRLSLYKRLADALDAHEIQRLSGEMQDRFGRPPPEARRFVQLMTMKTTLRQLKVLACEASSRSITLHLRDDAPIDAAKLVDLLSKRGGPYKITPDMRLTRRAQPGEVFENGLQACERMLYELRGLASKRSTT